MRLHGSTRLINDGASPVDLTGLRGRLARSTDPDIAVTSVIETWVGREGLVVHPGQQAGFLTQDVVEIVASMIPLAANQT